MVETVVVTASKGSFPGLVLALKGVPADVREFPLISFMPPADWAPVDRALGRLGSYGAIAITSPRAAAAVAGRLDLLRKESGPMETPPPVWAGGTATADALGGALGPVQTPGDSDPGEGVAESLSRSMLAAKVPGPVLFLCGATRRDELPGFLRCHGTPVVEVVCYRSVLASESEARRAVLSATVVVVASPSVADLLVRACLPDSRPDLLAVGPTTASSARKAGWIPAAVAARPTAGAVAEAVESVIAKRSPHE